MSRISYVNGKYCEHNRSYVHIEDRGFNLQMEFTKYLE